MRFPPTTTDSFRRYFECFCFVDFIHHRSRFGYRPGKQDGMKVGVLRGGGEVGREERLCGAADLLQQRQALLGHTDSALMYSTYLGYRI